MKSGFDFLFFKKFKTSLRLSVISLMLLVNSLYLCIGSCIGSCITSGTGTCSGSGTGTCSGSCSFLSRHNLINGALQLLTPFLCSINPHSERSAIHL